MGNALGTTIGYAQMTPTMGTLSGLNCVMDDILIRISTAQLWYDPNYGYDVTALVNTASAKPSSIVGRMETEIKKDPRITQVTSQSSFLNGTLTITSQVTVSNGKKFTLIGTTVGNLTSSQLTFTAQAS